MNQGCPFIGKWVVGYSMNGIIVKDRPPTIYQQYNTFLTIIHMDFDKTINMKVVEG